MARNCPACGHGITIFSHKLGGLITRHERKPQAGWFRYAPPRFFCPTCGVELLRKRRPLAYWIWAGIVRLFIAAALATVGILPLGSWSPYRGDIAAFWILATIPLVLAQARWGIELVSAPRSGDAAPPTDLGAPHPPGRER